MTEQQCLICKEIKPINKFNRNRARGKAFGYQKKCNQCLNKKYHPWTQKPKNTNKYDCRFKWATATEAEKLQHAKLVFDLNVQKTDSCWIWTGYKDKDGYGRMNYEHKMWRAPRLSWLLHYGKNPGNLLVLHNCPNGDNPGCVNPKHLFLGTAKDNRQDCLKKERMPIRSGEKCNFVKLCENDVVEIKKLLKLGVTQPQIGKMFNVSRGAICDIARGRNWKHVQI